MKISVAKNAGFCFGVKNAIEMAYSCGTGSVTLGELIHNDIVVKNLAAHGVVAVDDIAECENKTVVIRSHGVGRDVADTLAKRALSVVDATCPFVKRIHDIVAEKYAKGYRIVIVGEENHPEVIGTNGWCDYTATIINSVEKAQELVKNTERSLCVVCQTTFSYEKFKNIKDILKNYDKIVEIFDTICYTTKDRQREALELAKTCDCMLVIGSDKSSNTLKLLDICSLHCRKTFLITCTDDLSRINCNNIQWLGITAGASTPNELIQEVVNTMSESQGKENQMNEFERLFAQEEHVEIRAGRKVEVTVMVANEEGITVSFGAKKDAFIDKSEVELDEADYNADNYPAGMTFMAEIIEKKGKHNDMLSMSKKRIEQRIKEQIECEEILKGSDFTVKIEKAVKGGLLSKLGPYTIFIPQSQIRMGYESNIEKYVGKDMKLRMIPSKAEENAEKELAEQVNENGEVIENAPVEAEAKGEKKMGRRIVASHRVLIEEEKNAREEAFWSTMEIGGIVKGKVKRFTDFGAFVSVNGNDCLAHISDLSWIKVASPSDVLELNKTYDFLVLNADRETGKVSLGYKQLQPKPYEEAFEKYPVGTIVGGTVERIFNYGAFITIDKGIDGLIPVSEISYSYVKDANEAFTVGQEIQAQVIKFEGNKITLSVKALLPAPVQMSEVELTEDDIREANEKRAKANARRFENAGNTGSSNRNSKPRGKRNDDRDDVKSWTTEASSATFADLFKGLNFEVSAPAEEATEEVKVKKPRAKKVVEEIAEATESIATEEAPVEEVKVKKPRAKKVVAEDTEATIEVVATEEVATDKE